MEFEFFKIKSSEKCQKFWKKPITISKMTKIGVWKMGGKFIVKNSIFLLKTVEIFVKFKTRKKNTKNSKPTNFLKK